MRSNSGTQQMTKRRLDETSAHFTEVIGRRSFFRKAGGVGLMAGLAAAGLTLRFAGPANARGSCAGGACGPSPICWSGCSGATCVGSNSNRGYGGFACNSWYNAWAEAYCVGCATPGTYQCGDCCSPSGGGSLCSGCSSTKYACICRHKIGNWC